jgi:hypothetical protein
MVSGLAPQEIYDPGHPAEVTWLLPDEDQQEPSPEHFAGCPPGSAGH